MGTASAVLAHAGGWDEALLLLGGPVIVFLVLRSMGRHGAEPPHEDPGEPTPGDQPPTDDG